MDGVEGGGRERKRERGSDRGRYQERKGEKSDGMR